MDLGDLAFYDHPAFPLSVAAEAANMDHAALRQWFSRYEMTLWGDQEHDSTRATDRGLAHRLTFRHVLHIAVTAKLVAAGVSVVDAYKAAIQWVHFSDPASGRGNEPIVIERLPAALYGDTNTLTALVHFEGADAEVVRVHREGDKMIFSGVDLMFHGLTFNGPPPKIIILNHLVSHARAICTRYLQGGAVEPAAWEPQEEMAS